MRPARLMTAATLFAVIASGAWAANYRVQRSVQLLAEGTAVWRVIGDFCDIDDWHPQITACALKVTDGRLHRVLTTTEGAETVQQRIAVEPGLSYTYKITSTPLPVERYTATLSIERNSGTTVSWSARFTSDDPAMEAAVAGNMEAGLSAIEDMFAAK